ncbi:aminotransferase class IV [Gluconobacter sp. OJB]|uniref:aminotransferase class IV n=1 Tax=Gluconobacter sp. OJB TaxID=3145196 RepID=UPI0031F86113
MSTTVWLNGCLLDIADAHIAPNDRGFLLSDGLFETIRVANGQMPHLARHLARLEEGCAILRLPAPDRTLLIQAISDLLHATKLSDGSLRLTVTRGTGPRGLVPPATPHPTVLIQATASLMTVPPPVRLGLSRYRRDGTSPLARVKSIACLPSIMSRMEAVAAGMDDALLLGTTGAIAEASAANILFLREGCLQTPPIPDGTLPGTSRARLLEDDFCTEGRLLPQELKTVTGAWLVNALSLTAVSSIDGHDLSLHAELDRRLRAFLFPA